MRLNRETARSFFGLDAAAAVGLTLAVFLVLVVALQLYSNARRDADYRRLARLAAEAELERLRFIGVDPAAPDAVSPRDANGVVIERAASPGEGPWTGLMRITLVARKVGPGYRAAFTLAGYAPIADFHDREPASEER